MEKDEGPTIHLYNDSSFSRILELSESTYAGREIADSSYINWEYLNNPDGVAVIKVAESLGKIVSQYVVLPRRYIINGNIKKGSLSVNTLTHPAYRGHGLFPKLATETFKRCLERDILFTVGFPNPVSAPVIKSRKLFETIGALQLMIKPLNPIRPVLAYFFSRRKKTGTEIEMYIPKKYFLENENISVFEIDQDSMAYEKFLIKFNNGKKITTFRSLEFLKWRYINIPYRKYMLFKRVDNGEITAIAVVRARHLYGLRCGIITDLMFLEDSANKNGLISFIRKVAAYNKLDMLITALPAHSTENKLFRRSGFFTLPKKLLPQELLFIVKRHSENCPEEISIFSNWFLTFGDYDIF